LSRGYQSADFPAMRSSARWITSAAAQHCPRRCRNPPALSCWAAVCCLPQPRFGVECDGAD